MPLDPLLTVCWGCPEASFEPPVWCPSKNASGGPGTWLNGPATLGRLGDQIK